VQLTSQIQSLPKCSVAYIVHILHGCFEVILFMVGFTVKWSVQTCRSVTVTQQTVLNTVMKFCGTQILRIAGTYGRRQATEQTLFNDTVLHRNQYEMLITRKLIIELLSSLL
jgi:hypothetical protein